MSCFVSSEIIPLFAHHKQTVHSKRYLMQRYPWYTRAGSYLMSYPVEERTGQLTPHLEVVLQNGQLHLNSERVNYSFGALHDLFLKTFQNLDIGKRELRQVLVLGLGAGSVVSLLREDFKQTCPITGVEMDGVVLELGEKYFEMGGYPNLAIHQEDAFDFVSRCTVLFDLIIIDLFVEDATPPQFVQTDFLERLNKLLSASGLLCYNRMVTDQEAMQETIHLSDALTRISGPVFMFEYAMSGCTNWILVHDKLADSMPKDSSKFKPGSRYAIR